MAAPWVASLDGTLVGRRPKLSSGQNGVCPTWVSLTASIPEPLARVAVAGVRDTLVLGVTSAAWPGWDTSFQHDPGEDKGWMLLLPADPPDAAVNDAAVLGQVLLEQAPASSCCHHCSLECHKETAGDGSRGNICFSCGLPIPSTSILSFRSFQAVAGMQRAPSLGWAHLPLLRSATVHKSSECEQHRELGRG